MSSRRRRRKSRKGDKLRHDEHVRAYRKECRKRSIRECRDYKGYERKRREEGRVKGARIKSLRKLIRGALHDADEHDAARIVCLVDMTFRNHSYRVHVAYMNEHSGSVNMYGLKKVPSKSGLRDWAKRLAGMIDAVVELLGAQAAEHARGTLLGDSSGFSIMRYEDWEDAKKRIISRREFSKLHILMAPHGMIAACEVTAGRAHGSPVFREMHRRVPRGGGHVILDAAYLARANCDAIARSGRDPVICPKRNSRPNGYHARVTTPSGRCAQTTGYGTKSGSFPYQLPRSATILASSHARAHQNVHKSEAENSELDSAVVSAVKPKDLSWTILAVVSATLVSGSYLGCVAARRTPSRSGL